MTSNEMQALASGEKPLILSLYWLPPLLPKSHHITSPAGSTCCVAIRQTCLQRRCWLQARRDSSACH